jgi:hypothetical protein
MHDRAADLLIEAVDCVFFANFEQFASKEKGAKKAKMRGEGRRRMFTEDRPAFRAKNRFDLPFEMDLSWPEFVAASKNHVATASTDELAELFKGREDIATAYLVSIGWLIEGQKLTDLLAAKRKPILSRKAQFLKAVEDFANPEPEETTNTTAEDE